MIRSLPVLGSVLILTSLGCGGQFSTAAPQVRSNPAGAGATATEAKTPSSSPTAENATTLDAQQESVASAATEDSAALPADKPTEPTASPAEASSAETPPSKKSAIEPADQTVPLAGAPETAVQIDLTRYYQMKATEFDTYATHPWKDVPRGQQILGNVPLDIGGRVCLWGVANAEKGQDFPKEVKGIRIARKLDVLYLYHTTFHLAPDGAPVVQLVLNYENGVRFEKELHYGTHVRKWYLAPGDPDELLDPHSKRVWTGINSMVDADPPWQLQFFITEITNPNPLMEVVSIDLHSALGNAAPCILAMTAGPPGLLNVEPKPAADEPFPEN